MARRASSISTSATQREIYRFIRDFIADNGYSPSMREIGDAVGLASLASVSHQIHKLCDQGVLAYTPHLCRTIVLNKEVEL